MQIRELIKTIYLGDRYCKKIIIDSDQNKILIQIDNISRIRSKSGEWNFYTDEDIIDGYIVFNNVKSISFYPSGFIPNDLINIFEIKKRSDDNFNFFLSIDSVDKNGNHTDVELNIISEGFHLEDPKKPGIIIKN
jgi:hypothetical protein